MHGSFFFEAFISFQKWVLPAVSSGIAVDSGPNIALETCLFVFFAFSCVFLHFLVFSSVIQGFPGINALMMLVAFHGPARVP